MNRAAVCRGFRWSSCLAEEKERHQRGVEEERDEPSAGWYGSVAPDGTRSGVDVRVVLDLKHENTDSKENETKIELEMDGGWRAGDGSLKTWSEQKKRYQRRTQERDRGGKTVDHDLLPFRLELRRDKEKESHQDVAHYARYNLCLEPCSDGISFPSWSS